MIRYALVCEAGHEFEGWFGASADYDDQCERGLLSCPVCDSKSVRKQIMAPAVSASTRTEKSALTAPQRAAMMEMMTQMRRHVEDNFDYVGPRFAAEARAIHQGKAEERGIYGEASPDEVKALVEEGVPVAPLPPPELKKSEVN